LPHFLLGFNCCDDRERDSNRQAIIRRYLNNHSVLQMIQTLHLFFYEIYNKNSDSVFHSTDKHWEHRHTHLRHQGMQYDKQDQQGKAAFNEHNPKTNMH
jgi:hypothetical protein